MADLRKENEQRFHDETFAHDSRQSFGRFYKIVAPSRDCFQQRVLGGCSGLDVLEYGCGKGTHSFELAQNGANRVIGVDISPVAIRKAKERVLKENRDNLHFAVGDGEYLPFQDSHFDLVSGSAILHHLDIERSLDEIARVLKPDGMAAFIEPLDYNPAIKTFRLLTPHHRTSDEHPLKMRDLRLIRSKFEKVTFCYFHITTLLLIPFARFHLFPTLLKGFAAFDQALFSLLPFTRPLAWQVVMFLEKPVK